MQPRRHPLRTRAVLLATVGLMALPTASAPQPSGGSSPKQPLLYVSDVKDNEILRFDRKGRFVDVFVPSGSGGLEHPVDILRGPDGNGDGVADLLVASRGSMTDPGAVLRYDGKSGDFIDVFAEDILLDWPHDMQFGPDGDLYVGGVRSSNVVRFDGQTGALIGDFVSPGSGGLVAPHGLAFGRDLNGDRCPELYVGSRDTDEVLVYDGACGTFLRVFVGQASGGVSSPHDLLFDKRGRLLVTSHRTDEVLRYARDGSFLDVLVSAGSGGLARPHSMVHGPGGKLFVTSVMSDAVLRYKSKGTFKNVFAAGDGLDRPHGLIFLRSPK